MALDVEALFAAHHLPLYRYFYRALGHTETARDLTQDVFVRVTGASAPVGGPAEIQAWLFSIARNLLIDHVRRRQRSPAVADVAGKGVLAGSQETDVAVRQALGELPALDRDVFLMREVAGLDYAQIAAACELTAGGVRSRLHRTRLVLRERLAAPVANRQTLPMRLRAKGRLG